MKQNENILEGEEEERCDDDEETSEVEETETSSNHETTVTAELITTWKLTPLSHLDSYTRAW